MLPLIVSAPFSTPYTLSWASLCCVFYMKHFLQISDLSYLRKSSYLTSIFGSNLPVSYSCVCIFGTFIKFHFCIYLSDYELRRPDIGSSFVYLHILAFTRVPRYLSNEVRNNIPKFLYNKIIKIFLELKLPRI